MLDINDCYQGIVDWFSDPHHNLSTAPANPAVGDMKACYYRHPNGIDRCAVGCVMPDSIYDFTMENKTLDGIYSYRLESVFTSQALTFLSDAQRAHDSAETVDEFLNRLHALAELNYGLPIYRKSEPVVAVEVAVTV